MERLRNSRRRIDSTKIENSQNNEHSSKHCCPCDEISKIAEELNKQKNEYAKCIVSCIGGDERCKPSKLNKKHRCPFKKVKTQDVKSRRNDKMEFTDIKRKTFELRLKEQELAKNNLILQNKIAEYKKKTDHKAKQDLKAAKKLSEARKKLQRVLNARDKCEKRLKNKKKRKKTSSHWYSNVQSMLEKIGCCNYPVRNKRRNLISACEGYFKRICTLDCPDMSHQRSCCCCCSHQIVPRRQSFWDAASGDCYLMALGGRNPCLWPNNSQPLFFPRSLAPPPRCTFKQFLLCLSSFIMWVPCIICIVLCKCFFCVCCSDC